MRVSKGAAVGIAAFGIGYVLGTTINDRPVRFFRRSAARARARVNTLTATASRLAPWTQRNGDVVVDVRSVREVMAPVDVTVGVKTSLREAAALMERTGLVELVVVKKQRVRGIVSDRDIAVRALANGLDPTRAPVGDIMTRIDVLVGPQAPMDEAISLMRSNGIKRLIVVDDDGRAVGIVGDPALAAAPKRDASPAAWLARSRR